MRTTTILFGLIALIASSACSDDTGILVKVRTAEGFDERIDHLRFYVGEDTIADPMRYADNHPLPDIEMVNHNLAERPYSLLIRPRGGENERVVIGVAAFNDDHSDPVGVAYIQEPIGFVAGSVTEWDLELAAPDSSFSNQNDCFKWMVGDDWLYIGREGDADCDGVSPPDDCDDNDHRIGPNRRERCNNGVDDNCDGRVDPVEDLDFDTYYTCDGDQTDCDDTKDFVNPGVEFEECNGFDDNCDGLCDEGEYNSDGDPVTDCGSVLDENGQCTGYDENAPDCKPDDPNVYPGNEEVANGIDDNCTFVCDDGPVLDSDMDGFTDWGRYEVCSRDRAPEGEFDCNTSDGYIHPGALELCDGVDSDCDGAEIEHSPCFKMAVIGCLQGVRTCQDDVLLDDCTLVSDPANGLPPQLCEEYANCEASGVADPFECVLGTLGTLPVSNHSCSSVTTVDSTCEGLFSTIQVPGGPYQTGLCTYQLVGSTTQQGYKVGLTTLGSGDTNSLVEECQARLFVQAQAGAADATIMIIFSDGDGTTKIMEVLLTADVYDACNVTTPECTW